MITSFKYLGREISAADDDWPAVVGNLAKARSVWRRLTHILSREGVAPWVSGFFFKAVVQAVLIFGVETWVVTPRTDRVLGGFHDQVEQWLTGRLPRIRQDRKLEYTSTAEAGREDVGFEAMGEYIRRRQNTVAQFIAM